MINGKSCHFLAKMWHHYKDTTLRIDNIKCQTYFQTVYYVARKAVHSGYLLFLD